MLSLRFDYLFYEDCKVAQTRHEAGCFESTVAFRLEYMRIYMKACRYEEHCSQESHADSHVDEHSAFANDGLPYLAWVCLESG
jgi:hypothetical protein